MSEIGRGHKGGQIKIPSEFQTPNTGNGAHPPFRTDPESSQAIHDTAIVA